MASSTTIHTSQWSSTLKRLPSFSRKARKSHGPGSKVVTVSLHRCSSKSRPLAPRPRNDSTASCSSWSSSTSTLDGTSSPSTSKVRDYPSRCANMVITGVSALLLMPLPFLDNIKGEKSAKKDAPSESGSLKRVLSRRPQTDRRRRNSLRSPWSLSGGDRRAPSETAPAYREQDGAVYSPPPKFAPPIGRRWDEEPAWSDYM
ncbi:hypothetical protein B0H13DRAFT_2689881 [Mycena leptocephala]|nr:hypothetical protein B0H13DRAFT_2689881 [Mycena leptocephala]